MNNDSNIDIAKVPNAPGNKTGTRLTGRKANVDVQILSTSGGRNAQNDHYFLTPCFTSSARQAGERLKHAFLHANDTTSAMKEGTCATAAVISSDQFITVAHLGDSPAILYVRSADGVVTPYRLNQSHTPDLPGEKEWFEQKGGKLSNDGHLIVHQNGKAVARLNISRALGDAQLGDTIRRTPSISQINLREYMQPGDRAFLCVSCDGLFEKNVATERDYAEIIRQALDQGRKNEIAEFMKNFAIHRGSKDNITILLAEIPPSLTGNIALGVCDGHLGDRAATQANLTLRKHLENTRLESHPNAATTDIPLCEPPCAKQPVYRAKPDAKTSGKAAPVVKGDWRRASEGGGYYLLTPPLTKQKVREIAAQLDAAGVVFQHGEHVLIVGANYAARLEAHLPKDRGQDRAIS